MKTVDRRPPAASYMSKDQQNEYLQQLRSRPLGSRPAPLGRTATLQKTSTNPGENAVKSAIEPNRRDSDSSVLRNVTVRSTRTPFDGRPLAIAPRSRVPSDSSDEGSRRRSGQYIERGSRWMERQETRSLRMALEDMDVAEEQRIHAAARNEAAELVWQHQNPNASLQEKHRPYVNPDHTGIKDYRSHLRRGSYLRSHSDESAIAPLRQSSASSSDESDHLTKNTAMQRKAAIPDKNTLASMKKVRSTSGKQYDALAEAVASDIHQARRRSSGNMRRIMSGEKKFMNPNDRIWEDPAEHMASRKSSSFVELAQTAPVLDPPIYARKNPFARIRRHQDALERTNSAPILQVVKPDPTDSQSRTITSTQLPDRSQGEARLNGLEIRDADIRAATSKSRSDRSKNLPQPVMVSDQPGRPIVSFHAPEPPEQREYQQMPSPHTQRDIPFRQGNRRGAGFCSEPVKKPSPTVSRTASPAPYPTIPQLNFPDEHIQDVPSISVNGVDDRSAERHDTPSNSPMTSMSRPPVHHANSAPLPRHLSHMTPTIRPTGVICARCALSIAGRILSAAGQRFHPSCFVCHECNTNLELVAFYPEPESKRAERVASAETQPCSADQDFRFYCHLDYHERFSPRCKNCKTPIEGEMIVACGAEWHAGHFFCAQCGDPFDSKTPFVEKDGYAWCVGCHTNRYSSKCRKCRKPVTDLVIKALNADWHEQCFVCTECDAPFRDGRFFLPGADQDPVCVPCEERRLKK